MEVKKSLTLSMACLKNQRGWQICHIFCHIFAGIFIGHKHAFLVYRLQLSGSCADEISSIKIEAGSGDCAYNLSKLEHFRQIYSKYVHLMAKM